MNVNPRKHRLGKILYSRFLSFTGVLLPLFLSAPASAQTGPALDSGDTAWMLVATALVLFMTLPGLALFYGGLVRAKNVLSVLMQCLVIAALVSVLWLAGAYRLAFGPGSAFLGTLDQLFLSGLGRESLSGRIPETVFAMFQLTFAIITPALIIGAFAERMKFSALLSFMTLWFLAVYLPVCHWVWAADGWLFRLGALDFAGGTVVHINAGAAGLVSALVLGRRLGWPETPMPPHSMTLCVVGASMLWVGWFGFNAGSALAADGIAGMAMLVTHLACAAAALSWMAAEWIKYGKPSVLGVASGVVAGLVAITPAAGFVGPLGALAIGLLAGLVCQWSVSRLKRRFNYDDALDVFGVHGVGGLLGAILTGVFASPLLGGFSANLSIPRQLLIQLLGALATLLYSAGLTYLILKLVNLLVGLRVKPEEENMGLDLALHDERGYNL